MTMGIQDSVRQLFDSGALAAAVVELSGSGDEGAGEMDAFGDGMLRPEDSPDGETGSGTCAAVLDVGERWECAGSCSACVS